MIDKFKEFRDIAIDALRKCGVIVVTLASEVKIQIVINRIEASFSEETGYSVKFDGQEMANDVMRAQIDFIPGQAPTVTWQAKPKAIPLTAEEDEEMRKLVKDAPPQKNISRMPCGKN